MTVLRWPEFWITKTGAIILYWLGRHHQTIVRDLILLRPSQDGGTDGIRRCTCPWVAASPKGFCCGR
jgi:hypothetical protein